MSKEKPKCIKCGKEIKLDFRSSVAICKKCRKNLKENTYNAKLLDFWS